MKKLVLLVSLFFVMACTSQQADIRAKASEIKYVNSIDISDIKEEFNSEGYKNIGYELKLEKELVHNIAKEEIAESMINKYYGQFLSSKIDKHSRMVSYSLKDFEYRINEDCSGETLISLRFSFKPRVKKNGSLSNILKEFILVEQENYWELFLDGPGGHSGCLAPQKKKERTE